MSKVFPGTCEDGVVKVGDVTVPDALIRSEGVGASVGTVIVDEGTVFYHANTTADLKTTIQKLIDALDAVSGALTTLDAAGYLIAATAGVPSPPGQYLADKTAIDTAKSDLETLLGELK